MANSYSLADMRNDMDREFAPLQLEMEDGEILTLRNLMRVDESDRETVMEALAEVEKIQGEDETYQPTPAEMTLLSNAVIVVLTTVVDHDKGSKLRNALDGDMALTMKIMELWTEATQPGEAQNSPS